jgi:hypothetical protein
LKIDQAKYTFSYDLPFTVNELGKNINPSFKKKLGMGVFKTTNIQQVMDLQKEKIPNLRLPLTFVQLRSMLRRLHYEEIEGIFRLSPAESLLQDFIEKLKRGELDTSIIDPHIPATALKQYIRSIDPPLIPFELYEEISSKGSKMKGLELVQMVDRMPEENKALIHALVEVLQDVASPDHVRTTKMDFTNLSVCFAPALLKGTSDNTSDFMIKAKEEQAFCTNLFSQLNVDYTMSQLAMDSMISADGIFEHKS